MTTATHAGVQPLWWTPWRARWLLVAVHIPMFVTSPLFTILGLQGRPRVDAWVVVPLGVTIGVLQLWHSFAAARGERPMGWPWTLLALAAVVYIPMAWFTFNWATTQTFVIASAAMHLRGRGRAVAVAAPIVGTAAVAYVINRVDWDASVWVATSFSLYWVVGLTILPSVLYGVARLVRALDELHATRVELAQSAVGSERSRLSRDLHDLLGQSLTAVSLKGDLALALLPTDQRAAETEIRELTAIARDALHGTRTVTQGEHTISLRAELDCAALLLEAAGITTRIDVSPPDLAPSVDEALAWATREGVTNLLRHSEARSCSISASRREGLVCLEIVNDGSTGDRGDGSGQGLLGVSERVNAISGSASATCLEDGRFILRVEVPER